MDVSIREARPDEYAAAGELAAQAYLAAGLLVLGPEDPYLVSLRDAAARAAQAELLVAVDAENEALLGTVTFAAHKPFAEISGPHEAEFRMLAVDPGARGRGIGEALVRDCAERALRLGRRGLALSLDAANLTAARLYHRMGFVRDPGRDWSPVPGLTLRAYTLDLTAPASVPSE
ncbi:GNAT family N-acetyltransferase [Streptomyces sodiiphilus]